MGSVLHSSTYLNMSKPKRLRTPLRSDYLLSVIIPVYNEIQTIAEITRRVLAVNVPKELVIVDDGSRDGTREWLRKWDKPDNVRVFYHKKNSGKGAALQTGIRHARGDVIIFQDADLEYNPEEYPRLLGPILRGDADVVYGSRFKGEHRAFLFHHYLGNKFLTMVTNILYNTCLTDMETCYKMFRREVLEGVPLRSRRFDVEPEITAKIHKRGYKVFEVPISYSGRDFEEGKKITWRDGLVALWTLIKYRFVD
ncbi:MAG: glycosyltransferase family 2 protein [Candidatus Sumerlaeia bacterium]